MEKIGFEGFFSPIPYGFKELAGNPVRCVPLATGGERASAGKSDEKQRVTSVMYSKVRTISCCNTAEKLTTT